MGTGPTTATGALVNTICKRTGKNWMGKDPRWIDLPILACMTRTGMEPNHIAKIESSLWDISWDMWEHWNKELHSGGQVQLQIIHSTVNAQIAAAYASGAQQLPRDALHLLQSPVQTILQYPLALKQVWLKSIQVAQQHWQWHKFGRYHSEQWFIVLIACNQGNPVAEATTVVAVSGAPAKAPNTPTKPKTSTLWPMPSPSPRCQPMKNLHWQTMATSA